MIEQTQSYKCNVHFLWAWWRHIWNKFGADQIYFLFHVPNPSQIIKIILFSAPNLFIFSFLVLDSERIGWELHQSRSICIHSGKPYHFVRGLNHKKLHQSFWFSVPPHSTTDKKSLCSSPFPPFYNCTSLLYHSKWWCITCSSTIFYEPFSFSQKRKGKKKKKTTVAIFDTSPQFFFTLIGVIFSATIGITVVQ